MLTCMPVINTKTDEARQVAEYWDRIAPEFDSIYGGKKNLLARRLDHWLRKDMYQRFDWVMRQAEELRPATVCDIGCGSGRFVSSLAKRSAQVSGVDFAPEMLNLARQLVEREGVADRCRFVLSDVLDWKENRGLERTFLAREPGRTAIEIHVVDRKSLLSPKAGVVIDVLPAPK